MAGVSEAQAVAPATLDEAILRVQGSTQALDLRRNQEAEKGSARFRRYLDYPKLLRELRPVLQENQLTWQTFPTTLDGEPALRYVVTFVPTRESQEGVMKLMLDKQTSQAQGSALTYSKRYALQGVFDLAPDSDDDGAAASQPARPAPVDPEAPLSEDSVNAMLEAIAECGLSAAKVLERAGIAEDGTQVTVADGRKVKAILDEHDGGES
jgi:hypothetical protein